jgi:hypothetical protein
MKNIIRLTVVILMMTLCGLSANAQNNQRQRMSREQLAEAQANYIANQLALDDATTNKFVDTYCDFRKELWAIGPRMKQNRKGASADAQAKQSINDRFERSQKILALREKYYKRYSTFLTQKQIQRVYELERQIMRRLSQKSGKGPSQGRRQMRQAGK